MYKKSIIIIISLVIISVLFCMFFDKTDQIADVEYTNDKYGFTLTLNEGFNNSVEIIECDNVVYFVSKEIQEKSDMIFGVVGRIEIYDKSEFTKEEMMESGSSYSLKCLAENDAFYFAWAHATDVQVPPGDESLSKKHRSLETEFEDIVNSFQVLESSPSQVKTKTDTGRYAGRADNNSFEVKISGVPDEIAARVFTISDNVRTKFENLDLKEGEEIKIKYTKNELEQYIAEDIERIN